MKIFKKEKDVTELAVKYLDVVEKCVEEAESTVCAYLGGEVSGMRERAEEVSRLETKADKLRREMRDKLFSGAYLPLIRGDIFNLVEAIDGIPNSVEACCRFFYSEQPEIPEDFRDRFMVVARRSFGVIKPLKKSLKGFFKPKDKMESIRQNAEEISVEEAEVDALELDLTAAIFESDTLELAHKNHLRRAIGEIVEMSDRAEDTADRLLLIAMKAIA